MCVRPLSENDFKVAGQIETVLLPGSISLFSQLKTDNRLYAVQKPYA